MNIPESDLPRVVIIGAGFAGIAIAKGLKNKNVQVVLLDKNNYHTFQPLLYQVSTASLEPDSIAFPIRKIIKGFKDFYFRLADVKSINSGKKELETSIGKLSYDYLVIATGSQTNFFGNKNVAKFSMAMKDLTQSLDLRSLVLENFEEAVLSKNKQRREELMNFVVVGAGPTGVELAGALAEMKNNILPKDYPDLDFSEMEINLVEGAGKVLEAMSEVSSAKAQKFLEELGVNIYFKTFVSDYDGVTVSTNTDVKFKTATLIWAAGVMGAAVNGLAEGCVIERANRVKVDVYNRVVGEKDIFAIGDVACMQTDDLPRGHPMMAQPAIQQGKLLAKNLIASMEGKELIAFKYHDKGSMATIGRNKAVVDLKRMKFQGIFAWFIWMFVHLMSLVGFRNRTVVFFNWVYNYVRSDKGTRLIVRSFKRKNKKELEAEKFV
ncbi:NAD(P)/FAD-dependent oxidoreductase [Aureivirga marina]|uniref:NAD(P)/FAD-dependent oxidoreductase n=1 Tax=Aureivirga marina TaxID=1182451 RepID=UPI0018CA88D2|nr:NAD(P)/FAD-dependent oxidoreductase [Aureivirga marina]